MLALGLLGACRKEAAPVAPLEASRPEPPDANLVLFVVNANQSSPKVDIQVHIDGKLEINGTFSSEKEEPPTGIARHKVFHFRLSPGTHTLKAALASGGSSLEERVELHNAKRWALLMYGDESIPAAQSAPASFKFTIQDTPIYFE